MITKHFFHCVAMLTAIIATAGMAGSCSDKNLNTPDPDSPENPETPKPATVSVKLDREVEFSGMYFGNFWDEGYGNYYFELADGEIGLIESIGKPAPLNEGNYIFCLDIWGEISADHSNPILPEGTYRANNGRKNGCFDIKNTLAVFNAGKDGDKFKVKYVMFNDGTIEVRHTGEEYDITAKMVTSDGAEFSFTYTGKITFSDQSSDEEDKWEIGENVTLEPIYATKVKSQDKNFDTWTLRFFDTRNVTSDGVHSNEQGTKFDLSIIVPKNEDISGKYTPGNEPGNFVPGSRVGIFPIGTYCERVNQDMSVSYCIMDKGSIEISGNENGTYTFNTDLTTEDGFKVSGQWTIKLEDFTLPPQTTLTEDVVCNPTKCTEIIYYGDYYNNGTSNYFIFLETDTELVAFDLLSAKTENNDKVFPTGTFKISDTKEAGTALPGEISNGELSPSGYVKYNLESASASASAPFTSGELTVTKSGNQYTFTYTVYDDFNCNDPGLKPHSISGTFTGVLPEITSGRPSQTKAKRNLYY